MQNKNGRVASHESVSFIITQHQLREIFDDNHETSFKCICYDPSSELPQLELGVTVCFLYYHKLLLLSSIINRNDIIG